MIVRRAIRGPGADAVSGFRHFGDAGILPPWGDPHGVRRALKTPMESARL